MSWASAVPAFGASTLLLLAPGLLIGAFIRLRGLWLLAAAPAISLTTLGLASIILPYAGFSWAPLPVLLFLVIFGTVVVLLFRFVLKVSAIENGERTRALPVAMAWLFGGIPLGMYAILAIGSPQNISQTFDNIFHLNTIAEITRSGSASPFTVGALVAPDGGQSFYPDGWHAVVELVVQLVGASVPTGINAFNVAVATIVWPVGVVLLVRQFAGNNSSALIAAGVFSAAFPAAPLAMLYYGVLYPFFLGVVLIPVVLALVVNMLGLGRETRFFSLPAQIVLLAGLVPGITLAHPGAMMGALAFTVPLAVVATFAGWTRVSARVRVVRVAGLAGFGLVGLAMLYKLRPGVVWQPRLSALRAAWETFTLSLGNYGIPLLAALLLGVGIVVALMRRDRTHLAMLGMWAIGAALFFITAGVSNGILRGPTGVWYADTPRIAAMYPIVVYPLVIVGFVWVVESLVKRVSRPRIVACGALIIVFVVTHITSGFQKFVPQMSASYAATEQAALLSIDEIELLERVPDLVPEGVMIAGNPWTGSSLAYALSDRPVLVPHVFMKELNDDRSEVLAHLKYATPAACEAANDLGVEYVLDFGEREVHGGRHEYPGIEELGRSSAFEKVASEGNAALYRLVGCEN